MPRKRKRSDASSKGWETRRGRISSPTATTSCNRPKRLRQWENESMIKAMEAVTSGKMGANKAARTFNVPTSTLKDRIYGRVKHGTNPGPVPYLTAEEERELYDFLIQSSLMGYGKTNREVLSIVQNTLIDNFKGEGWWIRFLERNPKLSLQTTDPLSRVRKEEIMNNYFSLLQKTLTDNDILNKPARIFNMDETGMPLDAKQLKRVALKGIKVQGPASGIVASASSSGYVNE